ncbi:uncharacterized protein LOC120293694 [Eucalyptus grandis]|uniref:uncharacterized protein LOC120293694 n=1 Tax=Eucalyptus grandis TaxID=71139 RepID=UPI00192EC72D|nr:uncharacterized protein LOC120293694 [Eucalyptus grandis]
MIGGSGATVLFEEPTKGSNNVGVVVSPVHLASLGEFGSPQFVADKLIQAEKHKVGASSIDCLVLNVECLNSTASVATYVLGQLIIWVSLLSSEGLLSLPDLLHRSFSTPRPPNPDRRRWNQPPPSPSKPSHHGDVLSSKGLLSPRSSPPLLFNSTTANLDHCHRNQSPPSPSKPSHHRRRRSLGHHCRQPPNAGLSFCFGKYYLVDAGYPNSTGYLGPYKEVRYHLPEFQQSPIPTGYQEVFNRAHSSLRLEIERAFGVLKKKWKILKYMPNFPFEKQVKIVIVAMTLHNYIRRNAANDRHFARADLDPNYGYSVDLYNTNEGAVTSNDNLFSDMARLRDQIAMSLVNT